MDTGVVRRVRRPWERMRSLCVPEGESMTEQSHASSCDINNVIRRHARQGDFPPPGQAQFVDCTHLSKPLAERIAFSRDMIARYEAFVASESRPPPEVEPQGPASEATA